MKALKSALPRLKIGSSSKPDASSQLPIPCLGRPVSLGSLYDARSDSFLVGMKLWAQDAIDCQTGSRPDLKHKISLETDDTFADKANLLGMSPALKLSFLCGNIHTEGSAQYLNDSKMSPNVERLTLAYTVLTRFEELQMDAAKKLKDKLRVKSATHFVAGIRYGARAFLVFEKDRKPDEAPDEAKQSLERAVLALKAALDDSCDAPPKYSCEGDSVDYETIRCRYFGDIDLDSPPLNLKQAFGCISELTKDDDEIALEVFLTPLSQVGGKKASASSHEISEELLNEAGNYFQVLNGVLASASAQMKSLASSPWRAQHESTRQFFHLVETLKTRFSHKLSKHLPKAREDAGGCEKISKLLSRFGGNSPFSPQQLQSWVANRDIERLILQDCASSLSKAGVELCKDAADKHHLDYGSQEALLLEVNFPESGYLRSFKAFLDKKMSPSSPGNSLETWVDTDDQNKINELVRDTVQLRQRSGQSVSVALISGASDANGGHIQVSKKYHRGLQWHDLELPPPPRNFSCDNFQPTSAKFSWLPVSCEFNQAVRYQVDIFLAAPDCSEACATKATDQASVQVADLNPSTEYKAKITTLTLFGDSKPSKSIRFRTLALTLCSEYVKEKMCHSAPIKKVEGENFPGEIFQLKKEFKRCPEGCKCPSECVCPLSFEIRDKKQCMPEPAKFLLVVGETGTGKSTFINNIANAFYGVRFKSNYRLRLVPSGPEQHPTEKRKSMRVTAEVTAANQAHSQTKAATVYTLFPVDTGGGKPECRSAMNCPLTIIDTPGFGDTRGLEEDKVVVNKISRVLGADGKQTPGMCGVLHAIGFVVKASQNRLTIPQKYIFDQALSLFGNDVLSIILPLLTFADSNEPQALAALKEDGIPHDNFLKFNNAVLYADNTDAVQSTSDAPLSAQDRKIQTKRKANVLDWDQLDESNAALFEMLDRNKDGVSLEATRDVLKARQTLENARFKMMKHVNNCHTTISAIEEQINLIETLDTVIKDAQLNKTQVVKVTKLRERPVVPGHFSTLCNICQVTCHDNCSRGPQSEKKRCRAINIFGKCTVCPKKCDWKQHRYATFYLEYVVEEETVCVKDIAEKYQVSVQSREAKTEILRGLTSDLNKERKELSYHLVTVHKCLEELEKHALRQYPLGMAEYVDSLITAQETEKKPGWEDRVKHLVDVRTSAVMIAKAREREHPLEGTIKETLLRCESVEKGAPTSSED